MTPHVSAPNARFRRDDTSSSSGDDGIAINATLINVVPHFHKFKKVRGARRCFAAPSAGREVFLPSRPFPGNGGNSQRVRRTSAFCSGASTCKTPATSACPMRTRRLCVVRLSDGVPGVVQACRERPNASRYTTRDASTSARRGPRFTCRSLRAAL